MRVITFKVEEDLFERLDTYTATHRMAKSELIRALLRQFLDQEEAKQREKEETPAAKVEKMKGVRF